MKKLLGILTVLLVFGMAGQAQAVLDVEASAIDSAHLSFTVEVDTADGNPPDSGMHYWYLLSGTVNPPTVITDSIKASFTFPDTMSASGLIPGTRYYFQVVAQDSITTDTTAVDSVTTTSPIDVAFSFIDSSSDYMTIEVDTTDGNPPDSGMHYWYLLAGTTNPPTAITDSIKASFTFPDTMSAAGLTPGTKYYFLVVAQDSIYTDTTAVDSFTTASGGTLYGFSTLLGAGYSTQSIWVDWATPDSGFHPKKIRLYLDAVNGTTPYDSIETTSITDPDTFAVTGLKDGTTYYWKIAFIDSGGTTWYPVDQVARGFTTTDFTQNLTITTGYSTALIIHDSVGYYVAPLDSLIFRYGTVSGTYPDSSVITSVTHPDSVALTGLMEGGTYYGIMVAFLADSAIVDSTSEYSFTTTDLTVGVTVLTLAGDSVGIVVDSNVILVDSLIFQTGAGLITAIAETLTTVTGVDTFYVVDMMLGGVYKLRVLAFLADSSAIETTTTLTYTMPEPWAYNSGNFNALLFDGTVKKYKFTLDQASDTGSTGLIDITGFKGVSITGILLGEDDAAQYDSGYIVLYTINQIGTRLIIDSLMAKEPDTATTIGEVQQYLFDLPSYAVVDTAAIAADDFYQYIEVVGQLTCHADSIAKVANVIGTRPIYITVELKK